MISDTSDLWRFAFLPRVPITIGFIFEKEKKNRVNNIRITRFKTKILITCFVTTVIKKKRINRNSGGFFFLYARRSEIVLYQHTHTP